MKTVNFLKQAITSIMSLALLAPITMPSQAGVPVIDVSAIAQAIVQVNNQISQIKQLDQQIKAITDNGNYADLLNNPLVRKELNKYLPKGYNDIFEAARAGDLGALEQVAKAAAERERQAQTTQTGIERQKSVALLTQAQMTQMMQGMDVRSQRLQSLVNRINTTTNMAQKQDLMNTISAETAMINLEMNKMLVLMKQAEHQEKLANRQAGREYAKKAFQ